MDPVDNPTLARICREQAMMTGSPDVRASLLELAVRYEERAADELANAEEPLPQQVE